MSHEGSEITALILGGQTRKLHVTHLGTMGKQQETIYLENARPVWVTRIQTTYDAPLSGRTVERVEELLYFQNGQLIQRDLMPITFVNSIARRGKRWLHQTRITSPVQARQWESIACKWQQHVSHYKRALIRKD